MPHAAGFASSSMSDPLSESMKREIDENRMNGVVGTMLVSETDEVRVWQLRLPPGQRSSFHRHVLSYFWTSHSYGTARSYFEDGSITDMRHAPGDTRHVTILPGNHVLHAVANTGSTELVFTTVEYKRGSNAPLPVQPGCTLRLHRWT